MIRLYIGSYLIVGVIVLRYLQIKNPLSMYLPSNKIEMFNYRMVSNKIFDSILFTLMVFVLGVYLMLTSLLEMKNELNK